MRNNMQTKIIDGLLGYIKGCKLNGIPVDNWKVKEGEDGLIYLVNEQAQLALRQTLAKEKKVI
jgi:hypothetical protein